MRRCRSIAYARSSSTRRLVNPLGVKGIGELGVTAANAVYHATGKRIRDLPITLDKLL